MPLPPPPPLEPLPYAGPRSRTPRRELFAWGIFLWNGLFMFALIGVYLIVVPRFENVFRDYNMYGDRLPGITRAIFQAARAVLYGGFVLLLAIPVVLGFVGARVSRDRRWLLRAAVTLIMGTIVVITVLGIFLPLQTLMEAMSSGGKK
jgi:type II secretory pathway component PulF